MAGYAFLVLAETVFIRKPFTGEHLKLELFWSWRAWGKQRGQVIANVIMFIPIGVLAGSLWRWKGLWFAAGMSVVIEISQLVSGRGLCELDDVIHNCLGATIGIGIVVLARRLNTSLHPKNYQ
ncbi:MAG: VanZ family protein [Eubacterium sp.]|nr:VanZ family protein [Eubacterium sp.]